MGAPGPLRALSPPKLTFGGPVCGLGLLALGLAAIPERAFGLEFLGPDFHGVALAAALTILALLVIPLLYWVLIFLQVPDFLHPRWAREVRQYRRRFPQTSPSQPHDRMRHNRPRG